MPSCHSQWHSHAVLFRIPAQSRVSQGRVRPARQRSTTAPGLCSPAGPKRVSREPVRSRDLESFCGHESERRAGRTELNQRAARRANRRQAGPAAAVVPSPGPPRGIPPRILTPGTGITTAVPGILLNGPMRAKRNRGDAGRAWRAGSGGPAVNGVCGTAADQGQRQPAAGTVRSCDSGRRLGCAVGATFGVGGWPLIKLLGN